ncbi:uncharacterized protein METZ01_LOCUS446389, partial [marine metagenome]
SASRSWPPSTCAASRTGCHGRNAKAGSRCVSCPSTTWTRSATGSAIPSGFTAPSAPIRVRSSRTATALPVTFSNTPTACAPSPSTTLGPAPPVKVPRPTSESSGASRGSTAWPRATSAGVRIPTPPHRQSPTQPRATPVFTRRPGTKAGSPTRSSAPWPSFSSRSRPARNRPSAAATTSRPWPWSRPPTAAPRNTARFPSARLF